MPATRIAYLTGEYPAVSHTFILREVEALRDLGLDVLTCSIRRTGSEHHRGSSEKAAVASTFYVVDAAKNPLNLLRAHVSALKTPRQYWTALKLAWITRPPGIKSALYQGFYLLEAAVLARHLKAKGVTHLHNHFANSSCTVAMLASAMSAIPYSLTLHGPAIFFEPRKWRIDTKFARAQFVACISHFCRSQGMIFADPMDWAKMRIVLCGFDPQKFENNDPIPAQQRLLFVGRLAAVKGVRVLIEAFARARVTYPQAHLTLVGDGPERADIEAFIRQQGCQEAITLTGYLSQDEVAQELGRASIFTLPSFAEGVPVVLMEAMASRLPVVATRIAGISELVEDGRSGLTVPPGDVDALSRAIEILLGDPQRCQAMGSFGQSVVSTDYNITSEAAWLARLMTDLGTTTTLRPETE